MGGGAEGAGRRCWCGGCCRRRGGSSSTVRRRRRRPVQAQPQLHSCRRWLQVRVRVDLPQGACTPPRVHAQQQRGAPAQNQGAPSRPLKARVSRFPAAAAGAARAAAAAAAAAALDAGAGGAAGGGAGAGAGTGAGAAPLAPLSAEEEDVALEDSWVPGESTIALGKCPLSEAELDLAVTAAWAQCSSSGSSAPRLPRIRLLPGVWPYVRRTSGSGARRGRPGRRPGV